MECVYTFSFSSTAKRNINNPFSYNIFRTANVLKILLLAPILFALIFLLDLLIVHTVKVALIKGVVSHQLHGLLCLLIDVRYCNVIIQEYLLICFNLFSKIPLFLVTTSTRHAECMWQSKEMVTNVGRETWRKKRLGISRSTWEDNVKFHLNLITYERD